MQEQIVHKLNPEDKSIYSSYLERLRQSRARLEREYMLHEESSKNRPKFEKYLNQDLSMDLGMKIGERSPTRNELSADNIGTSQTIGDIKERIAIKRLQPIIFNSPLNYESEKAAIDMSFRSSRETLKELHEYIKVIDRDPKRESIEKHLAQNRIEHQIAQRESLLENEIKSSIQDIKQKYLSLFPSERDENKKHDILIPTEVQIFDEKRTKKPLEIKPHSIKDIYLKPEGRINSRSANTSGLMTRKSQSQTGSRKLGSSSAGKTRAKSRIKIDSLGKEIAGKKKTAKQDIGGSKKENKIKNRILVEKINQSMSPLIEQQPQELVNLCSKGDYIEFTKDFKTLLDKNYKLYCNLFTNKNQQNSSFPKQEEDTTSPRELKSEKKYGRKRGTFDNRNSKSKLKPPTDKENKLRKPTTTLSNKRRSNPPKLRLQDIQDQESFFKVISQHITKCPKFARDLQTIGINL